MATTPEVEIGSVSSVVGDASAAQIASAKLLVVGAGGIGCELLKNLALLGFKDIHVIDLDTIDVSNLNRQFLFRRHHVGMRKAEVAKVSVETFCPSAKITAHFGNVRDSIQFGLPFFQQFTAILNALDNADARKHVNRLCLAASIPLIESGSTGFLGQVMPILPGVTECYECFPVARPKSFPVCTIRSTPEKPEHCIAWAKYLFELLFGSENSDNMLVDLKEEISLVEADAAQCDADIQRGAAVEETQTDAKRRRVEGENGNSSKERTTEPVCVDLTSEGTAIASNKTDTCLQDERVLAQRFAEKVYSFAFDREITKQIALPDAFLFKKPPIPLVWSPTTAIDDTTSGYEDEQHSVWDIGKCQQKFVDAIVHMKIERKGECGSAVFDKDDDTAVQFVAAASNLRMSNFHISRMSLWDIQSIAGAIIPAIASTNAIVAGLQVSQLLHVMSWKRQLAEAQSMANVAVEDNSKTAEFGNVPSNSADPYHLVQKSNIRLVWVMQAPSSKFVLRTTSLDPPKPSCFVCKQNRVEIRLHSLQEWRLVDFVQRVVKKGLGFEEPLVELGTSQKCIYDPEEEAEADSVVLPNLQLPLSEWNIATGEVIIITDLSQGSFQTDAVIIEDKTIKEEENPDLFVTSVLQQKTSKDESEKTSAGSSNENELIIGPDATNRVNELINAVDAKAKVNELIIAPDAINKVNELIIAVDATNKETFIRKDYDLHDVMTIGDDDDDECTDKRSASDAENESLNTSNASTTIRNVNGDASSDSNIGRLGRLDFLNEAASGSVVSSTRSPTTSPLSDVMIVDEVSSTRKRRRDESPCLSQTDEVDTLTASGECTDEFELRSAKKSRRSEVMPCWEPNNNKCVMLLNECDDNESGRGQLGGESAECLQVDGDESLDDTQVHDCDDNDYGNNVLDELQDGKRAMYMVTKQRGSATVSGEQPQQCIVISDDDDGDSDI